MRVRMRGWAGLVALLCLALSAAATAAEQGGKAITTAKGPVGDLLRKWYAEGTAAGNAGDYYDNRDRGHSALDLALFPQMQKITYTPNELAARRDWAAQSVLLPYVVIGNSSTSAPPEGGGSNVRSLYCHPRGLLFLAEQYAHNNIYVYPEHRDYDAGHNGVGGYGDLYPTNTPYLITSQGSSGSDQAFLRAVGFTLAAFRPEVKKKLVETGMLMPTVQMILRATGKRLADPKEYLSGKAHPTVFDGADLDVLKMVQTAHDIKPENIPPVVRLKVLEEDEAANGRDFFEAAGSEKLADTVAVIARVVRGGKYERRIVVSAEGSTDVNGRPLTFHWALLRGDPERVKLKPVGAAGAVAEIRVSYHERRPIAPGAPMESNRVDVGVFVHNGAFYSAPGFVTFFTLDSEARTYDAAGRLLEVGYGTGEASVTVVDWAAVFRALEGGGKSWAEALIRAGFKTGELDVLAKAGGEYRAVHARVVAAQESEKAAVAAASKAKEEVKAAETKHAAALDALKKAPSEDVKAAAAKTEAGLKAAQEAAQGAASKADADVRAARKAVDEAVRAEGELLNRKLPPLDGSVRERVERALIARLKEPDLVTTNAAQIGALYETADAVRKAAFERERKRLAGLGVVKEQGKCGVELLPLREGSAQAVERLTVYERAMLARFNAVVLAELVLPGVLAASFRVNYVDPRISGVKSWRDVYRYDGDGGCAGWVRYDGERATEFNADGLMVLERDAEGRCVKARTVRYEQEPPKRDAQGRIIGPIWGPVRSRAGSEIVYYEFEGKDDRRGRVRRRELAPPAEK